MKQKEISYEEALKVIERGETVKCQTGREDQYEMVHNVSQLKYLYDLSKQKIQSCKIYPIQKKKLKISEKDIEISFDEAYKMIASGELIYFKEDKQEAEITTISQLINLRRASEARGEKLLLYWHE